MAIRNKFMRGSPASFKTSVVALLWRSEILVELATFEWGSLNAIGMMGPRGGRELAALI